MKKTTVAVVKGDDSYEMLKRTLKMIGSEKIISKEDRGLIKPNYVSAKHPSTGVTTDPHIVEGIIMYLKDLEVSTSTKIGQWSNSQSQRGLAPTFSSHHPYCIIDLAANKTFILHLLKNKSLVGGQG
jgi:uncharacterized protein (DUF362 family)